jgi:DNA-binding response OmpR family regulator
MLTARDSETDKIVGLGVGADDYLTKPFSPRELVARVQAILRRVADEPATDRRIDLGAVTIDPGTRRVFRDGEELQLTATEFDLLAHLARRPGTVMSREQLLADVWGYRDGSGLRTVDSHIRAIRRKVGADVIRTVHSVGYAVEPVGDGAVARG